MLGEVVRFLQAELGGFPEALRSQGGEVHGRPQGEESLVGADVARRLVPADVLLAGLQRQHPAAFAVAIGRLPDQPAGDLANVFAPAGHQAEVRAAITQRRAEALPLRDGDVGVVLPGPLENPRADRIETGDIQGPGAAGDGDEFLHVLQVAEEVRVLHHDGGGGGVDRLPQFGGIEMATGRRNGHERHAEAGQVRGERLSVFGVQAFRDDHLALAVGDVDRHQHRLGHGRAALVEAGVGDVHAGQLADERLVLVKGLQAALAGLGLVRRVGRVKLAAGTDRVHHGRNEVVVGAAAEETDVLPGRLVLATQGGDVLREFDLPQGGRDVQRSVQAGLGRDRGEQFLHARGPDGLQHGLFVVGRVQNVWHGRVFLETGRQVKWQQTQRKRRFPPSETANIRQRQLFRERSIRRPPKSARRARSRRLSDFRTIVFRRRPGRAGGRSRRRGPFRS